MNWHHHCLGTVAISFTFAAATAQIHPFTVKDDIQMVRFSDPSATQKGAVAKLSPDERYFAAVTSRGIIETDQIESVVSVFRTGETDSFVAASEPIPAPRPRASVKFVAIPTSDQSSTYPTLVTDLRWSLDSRDLYFIAQSQRGDQRLYRFNIDRAEAIPLTPEGYNVSRFDFTATVVVYSAWRYEQAGKSIERTDDQINADARAVTGESIENVLFPNSQLGPTDRELWVIHGGHEHPIAVPVPCPPQRDISWLPEAFTISPKGDMLIQPQAVTDVPRGWNLYEPAHGFEDRRIRDDNPGFVAADNIWRLKEYSLVNLSDGSRVGLVHAPQGHALAYTHDSQVVWSPDERRVLLTNTFLSLNGVEAAERVKRLRPCAIADVQLASQESHCVIFASDLDSGNGNSESIERLSFGGNNDEVVLIVKLSNGSEETRKYVFKMDTWHLVTEETIATDRKDQLASGRITATRDLTVAVRQGLNEPPMLWATNVRTGQNKKLWDPNPHFSHLQLGVASAYRWQDDDGHEWKGGLVKPVGYIPGKRYPLVIQVYNFDEGQFLTDGLFPTAFAARALASAGIVVLQVQRKLPHTFDDVEAQVHVEAFRSAIERLSQDGLVDAGKVGLVGFSVSSWYVENALIRDPKLYTAATIADGLDVSYVQYHLWGPSSPVLKSEFEKIIGSKPIGDGLKQWLKFAPGFHLDQVTAALRIEAITPVSIIGEWELYSSLRLQNKPVDLIYFPDGQHIHQKPLERLASQQGDVDWFQFWLQGYEDPDPSKRAQYKRWNELKALKASTVEPRQ